MMATILPYAIVLTRRCIMALVLPQRYFLYLLPNYTNISGFFFYLNCIATSLKYSFLNTHKQQYFMWLTSGG